MLTQTNSTGHVERLIKNTKSHEKDIAMSVSMDYNDNILSHNNTG
jgi:hypothetical protein